MYLVIIHSFCTGNCTNETLVIIPTQFIHHSYSFIHSRKSSVCQIHYALNKKCIICLWKVMHALNAYYYTILEYITISTHLFSNGYCMNSNYYITKIILLFIYELSRTHASQRLTSHQTSIICILFFNIAVILVGFLIELIECFSSNGTPNLKFKLMDIVALSLIHNGQFSNSSQHFISSRE